MTAPITHRGELSNMPNVNLLKIIVAAGLLSPVACAASAEDATTPIISVSGSDEVHVVPDEVVLVAGVESRAESLEEAADDNATKIAKVIDFLHASQVPKKNIRTEWIGIEPIFSPFAKGQKVQAQVVVSDDPFGGVAPPGQQKSAYSTLRPTGYVVRRNLQITMNNLDHFEPVYRGLIERGVNNVNSIQFRSTKMREYQDQARVGAIRIARKRAEALAGELGAKLAGVQSIVDSGSHRMEDPFAMSPFGGRAESSGAIAAGQIKINASVSVVFRLSSTEFE